MSKKATTTQRQLLGAHEDWSRHKGFITADSITKCLLKAALTHLPSWLSLFPSMGTATAVLIARHRKCYFSFKFSFCPKPKELLHQLKKEHTINSFHRFRKLSPETEQMGSDCKRLNFHLAAPFRALKSTYHLSLISWSFASSLSSTQHARHPARLHLAWGWPYEVSRDNGQEVLSPFYRWVNWDTGIRRKGW